MDHETNHHQQTNHQFRRLPKGERRVRFADSMGMELVSIFLFDLISNYYFASIHNHQQLPPPKTIPKLTPSLAPKLRQSYTTKNSNNNNNLTTNLTTTTTATNNNNLNNDTNSLSESTAAKSSLTQKSSIKSQLPAISLANNYNKISTSKNYYNRTAANSTPTKIVCSSSASAANPTSYICEFTQPISLISFKERVKLNKVHLETCSVNERAGNISVSCTIRVLNLSYDKSVIVRYTTDNWHTSTDSLASYKPGSYDGWSDKFTSTFSVTNQVREFQTGQRIVFAIRYIYDGDQVFWDNNGGLNYSVKKV